MLQALQCHSEFGPASPGSLPGKESSRRLSFWGCCICSLWRRSCASMSTASSVAVVAQREVWASAGGLTQLLQGVWSAAHQQQHSGCSSGATSAPPDGLKVLCRHIFTLLGCAGCPDTLQCFPLRCCYWSFFAETLSMGIEKWCQDGMGEKGDTCDFSFVLCNLYFTFTLI